jgi:hypothetical protein
MRIGIRNERHTDLKEIKKELSGTTSKYPSFKTTWLLSVTLDGGILMVMNLKAF